MNARKIFKNCLTLSAQEAGDFVKNECHKLQTVIFSVMPAGCFLKMWKVLDLRMVFMLSPEMIEKKMVSRKDICSLCSATECPYNKVDYKDFRNIKVMIVGLVHNQ